MKLSVSERVAEANGVPSGGEAKICTVESAIPIMEKFPCASRLLSSMERI